MQPISPPAPAADDGGADLRHGRNSCASCWPCIVDKRENSQITLEVRSEGIGTDLTDFLLGIPAIYIPGASSTTGNVPLAIPELAILKRTKQRGFAGFAYVAFWNDTGEIVANSGPYVGDMRG